MKPVAAYLDRLFEIKASRRGTPELSYRAALENLLNAIGARLDPAVVATAELADTGAGRPDFGIAEAKSGNLRAVVEVKSAAESVPETASGEQVTRYGKQYGYVVVTNYWDFLLVVCGGDGVAHVEHRYRLAASPETFWDASASTLAKEHADSLEDFLASAMTRAAPIVRPSDLASDLARHAREARRRLAGHDLSVLQPLQEAMERRSACTSPARKVSHSFSRRWCRHCFTGCFLAGCCGDRNVVSGHRSTGSQPANTWRCP